MRFSSTMGRRLVAVSAAILALQGANAALAQFVPYGAPNQGPNQGYVQQQGPNQGYVQQQQVPQFQPQPYQTTPQYTAMAFLGGDPAAVAAPAQTVVPGPMQNGGYAQGAGSNGQSAQAVNYSQPAPAPNYASYGGGCTSGSCGAYNTFDRGLGYGRSGYGGGYAGGRSCGPRWFGGYYGLYMGREGNNWVPLAFSTSTANAPPYYPTDTEFVINLRDLDHDFQGGAEVRLGFTFGGAAACDPCGGGGGCGPRHAVEGAYWGLVEDEQSVAVTDLTTDANRLYGMIDFRGLEADMGAGYRPMNHYFDYGPPTEDYTNGGALDDIEVRSLTARSNFSLQNIELNLLRLPVLGGGYGGGGGCDSGCGGAGGCSTGSCGGPRYSLTTSIGARYLRIDEDFYFRSDWENVTTPATGFAAYNVQADNHLVGAQLGCNGIYRVGCSGKFALHCSSAVGVYGNHMEVSQSFDLPVTGDARYANGTNANFDVTAEDDDIAFVGELRIGSSYQYSCNWRLYSGYRVMGISGVALSFDQVPSAFITPNQMSYVASSGSIFVHGLQAGVEFTY